MPASWITATDPWLTRAMRHSTDIAAHEQDVLAAVVAAMTEFLELARAQVLDHTTPTTAAAQPLPPNVEGYPVDEQWTAILAAYTAPPLGAAFGAAFLATAATATLAVEPFREAFVTTVTDRLSENLWAAGVFEEIRYELQEAHQAGEDIDQIRDRIGAVLHIDAYSRQVRARINEHKRRGEPVPSSLYERLRDEDYAWHYLARRIARTETLMAYNTGTYDAGMAWQEASGDVRHKMWLATTDSRVRPSHWVAHGQVRPAGEPFTVGGVELDHPGQAGGPPHEVIQCRCTLLWLDADEAEQAQDRYERELPNRTDIDGRPLVADAVTEPSTHTAWEGPLCPLGARSGDGRVIGPPEGEPRVVDHPGLAYQRESAMGHDGKFNVGRIEQAWVADAELDGVQVPHLWARGTFDTADPDAPEVIRKMRDGYAGSVSVDLDDALMEERWQDEDGNDTEPPGDDEMERLFAGEDIGKRPVDWATDWRLAGVTLVQDPAFHTGYIQVTDTPEVSTVDRGENIPADIPATRSPEVTAAASGKTGLPLADAETKWDGSGAATRLAESGKLGDGHFWRDPDGDPEAQSTYKLPFADMVDGTLTAVPAGIHAAAAAVGGARGGVSIPEGDVDAVKAKIAGYYTAMGETPPWKDDDKPADSATTAAAGPSRAERIAAAVPHEPPTGWFRDPELTGPTKVRITDEGRVYGHVAAWGSIHAAVPGQQVPRCPEGGTYPRFHRHGVLTDTGQRVLTGPLATAGHAATDRGTGISAAMAHYDQPDFVVADVVCGEDAHGVWVSGALRPGVSALQVLAADRYSFSGDWREGGYMIAACSVSVPGFHLTDDHEVHALAASADDGRLTLADGTPRARVDSDGHAHVLVASGIVRGHRRTPRSVEPAGQLTPNGWDFYRQFQHAQRVHQRVDAARARIHAPAVASAVDRINTARKGA